MSQQRVHVPDASLPSPGSARAIVPPLQRYYQGTATSCRPFRRTSFPSSGRYHGCAGHVSYLPPPPSAERRAWGWSPGIPGRDVFRGDDRISQVPGEPPFPFAHVLRPRPADTSLTTCGTFAWPPRRERRRRRQQRLSRLNSMAFGLAAYVSRCWSPVTAQGSLPGAGQALPGGLSPAGLRQKVFNSPHVGCPPLPSFLAQSPRPPPAYRSIVP